MCCFSLSTQKWYKRGLLNQRWCTYMMHVFKWKIQPPPPGTALRRAKALKFLTSTWHAQIKGFFIMLHHGLHTHLRYNAIYSISNGEIILGFFYPLFLFKYFSLPSIITREKNGYFNWIGFEKLRLYQIWRDMIDDIMTNKKINHGVTSVQYWWVPKASFLVKLNMVFITVNTTCGKIIPQKTIILCWTKHHSPVSLTNE